MTAGAAEAPADEDVDGNVDDVAVAVWLGELLPGQLLPTLRSLRLAAPSLEIAVCGGWADDFADLDVTQVDAADVAELVAVASASWTRHVLLVTEPVIVPPGFFERALGALADNLRIGTVSFLSNANGALSVPQRNTPIDHHFGSDDEVSITRRLRELAPPGRFAPLPLALGPVTLLSRHTLAACGGLEHLPAASPALVREIFGLDAASRGFLAVVDAGTYVTRATDVGVRRPEPIDAPGTPEHAELIARHPYVAESLDELAASREAPAALALSVAIAKIRGLRIAVDGSDIGPKEMGTQVQILSLLRELAARDDVESVQVAIPIDVPAYAAPFLDSHKITVVPAPGGDLMGVAPSDVIHRPSQPAGDLPIEQWHERANRVVLTIQDLIAYQVGAYLATPQDWRRYRTNVAACVGRADGIVVISNDTRRHVVDEALPVERDRVFLVENGTDHLSGAEAERLPVELLARGFVGDEFLLVLGTNYGHKNRDLAIRSWRLLRERNPQLALVMVGASVPSGSTRVAEARALGALDGGVYVLPDVTSGERNWLLRHAAVLLYPTSAEGFGLVPFEAAHFGTPAVAVDFDPLREVNAGLPVTASSWNPTDLAAATAALLADDALAGRQVDVTLANGSAYTWARTAAELVVAYRTLLDMPARWSAGRSE